jgi:hypothetical protein
MTAKLDLAKMEAAFKRAAHKALHGTREERSGRFLAKQQDHAAKPKHAARDARKAGRKQA